MSARRSAFRSASRRSNSRAFRRSTSARSSPLKEAAGGPFAGWRQFEGGAPDLCPLLAVQVVEELGEAGDQVGLGEEHVDRHPDAEPRLQLIDTSTDRGCMRVAFCGGRLGQIAQRESNQQAVQRLAWPGSFQQVEECFPAGAINRGVGILCRVAAGGVDQHGVLGEPPVAEPCAADTRDCALAHLFRQRKTQAGVQQGCRLAGARWADDRVPGMLVEIATTAQRFLQQVQCRRETRPQCLRLFGLL